MVHLRVNPSLEPVRLKAFSGLGSAEANPSQKLVGAVIPGEGGAPCGLRHRLAADQHGRSRHDHHGSATD